MEYVTFHFVKNHLHKYTSTHACIVHEDSSVPLNHGFTLPSLVTLTRIEPEDKTGTVVVKLSIAEGTSWQIIATLFVLIPDLSTMSYSCTNAILPILYQYTVPELTYSVAIRPVFFAPGIRALFRAQ